MKKLYPYLIVFLLIVSGYFLFQTYQLIQENKEINEGYDNNIQYAISLEDSIVNLSNKLKKLQEADRFSLQGNENAQVYLENALQGENAEKYITDKLFQTNPKKGNNPLIPFEGMEGDMKIDRIKILNNRWIIAHFTDGKYTGEMLIRYDINPDKSIDFTVIDQTLN